MLKAHLSSFFLPYTSYSAFQKKKKKKLQGMLKGKNKKLKLKEKKSEDANQAPEPDSDILEISAWEFKITMINMLRTLMDKMDGIQECMDTDMNL